MIKLLEFISDYAGYLALIILVILSLLAGIRSAIKVSKGKSISVPPVGVFKDLPSSVTGVTKHNDDLK